MSPNRSLKVLFLAAEATPFIKVGGLGDVAGSLPNYLRKLNIAQTQENDSDSGNFRDIDIRLVIPFHRVINDEDFNLKLIMEFDVELSGDPINAQVFRTVIDQLTIYLIAGLPISEAEGVYSSDPEVDGYKYAFFSLAALKFVEELRWAPDIIHANDWHTALSIYYWYVNLKQREFFKSSSSIMEVHNLPYLGVGAEDSLELLGLPPGTGSNLPEWAQMTPLPLGLMSADQIVTVSPTYAREILTPEFGAGLHELLSARRDSISGILNGLDLDIWDPHTDQHISENYNFRTISKRNENKKSLCEDLGLSIDNNRPLIAMVSRLDYQKGVDLALEALRLTSNQQWNVVILGTGEPSLEEQAHKLEQDFPDRVRSLIKFDSPFSHRIYASTDILLIPSRYEPCGLSQMIAMRYGAVPVGRSTGGLRDTIFDYNQTPDSTGFIFKAPTVEALISAMNRSFDAFQDQRSWRELQLRGMIQDFSWEASAKEYLRLYLQLVGQKNNQYI